MNLEPGKERNNEIKIIVNGERVQDQIVKEWIE